MSDSLYVVEGTYGCILSSGNVMEPTKDHKVIRNWARARGALPAVLPGENDGVPGVLKFIIPGAHYRNRNLEPITWDYFFAKFDLLCLAFVFEERTTAGDTSSMNEILQLEPQVRDFRNWH